MDNHLKNSIRPGVPENRLYPLLVVIAAILARLPALGAYWNQDDWGFLAAAQGLIPSNWLQAHVLSQVAYWQLFQPVFGLATQPWAWTRLILHALTSLFVYRIGRRAGLGPIGACCAGLLFATSPLSFTPLYWASGVQDLLRAVFSLAALDLLLRRDRFRLWAIIPALIAIGEGALLLNRSALGSGPVIELASLSTTLLNLVQYAWWMASPWPIYTSGFHFLSGLVGLAIWSLWGWWAWRFWSSSASGGSASGGAASIRSRLPAAALLGSLLSLLPTAISTTPSQPYSAYAAFVGLALMLGFLVDHSRLKTNLSASPLLMIILCALLIGTGWTGMEYRLSRRDTSGTPTDPLVLCTSLSYESLRTIRALPTAAAGRIAILQIPQKETRHDTGLPYPTPLFRALGGLKGPALAGNPKMHLAWTHNVFSQHFSTIILADASATPHTSPVLRHWGLAHQAYIYLALNHLGEGRFIEARNVLIFGMSNSDTHISFVFDPEQLLVPIEAVRKNAQQFLDLIAVADIPREKREALLSTSRELLRTCGILPSITGG